MLKHRAKSSDDVGKMPMVHRNRSSRLTVLPCLVLRCRFRFSLGVSDALIAHDIKHIIPQIIRALQFFESGFEEFGVAEQPICVDLVIAHILAQSISHCETEDEKKVDITLTSPSHQPS